MLVQTWGNDLLDGRGAGVPVTELPNAPVRANGSLDKQLFDGIVHELLLFDCTLVKSGGCLRQKKRVHGVLNFLGSILISGGLFSVFHYKHESRVASLYSTHSW